MSQRESESVRGRPEVGPAVHIRLKPGLLADIDAWAKDCGITRAEAIRRLLQAGLDNQAGQSQ